VADSKAQPAPVGGGRAVFDLVMRDLEKRKADGVIKYGTVLRENNGRNPLMDAYQESLDLTMYLRQALMEQGL
jgi:hypothetical protein